MQFVTSPVFFFILFYEKLFIDFSAKKWSKIALWRVLGLDLDIRFGSYEALTFLLYFLGSNVAFTFDVHSYNIFFVIKICKCSSLYQ